MFESLLKAIKSENERQRILNLLSEIPIDLNKRFLPFNVFVELKHLKSGEVIISAYGTSYNWNTEISVHMIKELDEDYINYIKKDFFMSYFSSFYDHRYG